jgi:hypothetical protein
MDRGMDRGVDRTSKRIESPKDRTQKHSPETKDLSYYKTFAKKPSNFKHLYSRHDSESYSSSSHETDSTDEFPSPNTPVYRKKGKETGKDEKYLVDKIKELQKRVYEMETVKGKESCRRK